MKPAQRLHITPQLLHQAWQQRRRADWPATFEAAMQHPLLRRLVRAMACGLAQRAARGQHLATPDGKSRAANDHTTAAP